MHRNYTGIPSPDQAVAALVGDENTNLSAALDLAKRGLPVFPAGPGKRPLVKDWQARATADPAEIRRWWRKWPDAMPALPMGRRSGLAVLDVDLHGQKDGAAALRDLGHDPVALSPVTIATPSGGLHAYFRWPEGMGNSAAGLPAGVDVRGAGGYVIAPGASGPKGRYRATGDDLADLLLIGHEMLPEWPEALRPRTKAADDAPAADPGQIAFETLRAALMAVPNDGSNPDADSRDWWLTIGAGLHFETGGSADGLGLAGLVGAMAGPRSRGRRSRVAILPPPGWRAAHRGDDLGRGRETRLGRHGPNPVPL